MLPTLACATDDDPLTFLKLLEIEIYLDVFVVSQPPVNDPTVHRSLAYEHPALLEGYDQIEVSWFDVAAMISKLDWIG